MTTKNKENIVILGGGFGGVTVAKGLASNKFITDNYEILLISNLSKLLFTPSLYEFATAGENKSNVTVSLSQIFKNTSVKIIQEHAIKIDSEQKVVYFKDDVKYEFSFLVIAVGSIVNDRGIPGLKEHAHYFKTLEDARKIKSDIYKMAIDSHGEKDIRIVIGGAGYTGVEISSEMVDYVSEIALKLDIAGNKFKLSLISTSNQLFKELNSDINTVAKYRLSKLGVEVIENARILKLGTNNVETVNSLNIPFDIFIWTGGVKGPLLIKNSIFKAQDYSISDKVIVNNFLQVDGYERIFACGDCAQIFTSDMPMLAEVAINEGKIICSNIESVIRGNRLKQYKLKLLGVIVPMSKPYSYADLGKIQVKGVFGYFLQKMVYLLFLLEVLPIHKAFWKWFKYIKYLMAN